MRLKPVVPYRGIMPFTIISKCENMSYLSHLRQRLTGVNIRIVFVHECWPPKEETKDPNQMSTAKSFRHRPEFLYLSDKKHPQ